MNDVEKDCNVSHREAQWKWYDINNIFNMNGISMLSENILIEICKKFIRQIQMLLLRSMNIL